MISISINAKYYKFINKYATHFTLNGFSNLSKQDLGKASRKEFQFTGLYSELAFYLHRYGSIDKLEAILDEKVKVLIPLFGTAASRGDGGYDDSITSNGKTRLVDIKGSHCENKERIQYLNLVIPERELHKNMVYVAAFTIGKTREAVDEVLLAGWCITEDITKRWKIDPKKWAVPVSELRDMGELEQYIR
jgi:hypothetical protein